MCWTEARTGEGEGSDGPEQTHHNIQGGFRGLICGWRGGAPTPRHQRMGRDRAPGTDGRGGAHFEFKERRLVGAGRWSLGAAEACELHWKGGVGVLPNCGTGGEGQYGRWWEGSPSSGVGKTARGVPRGWGAEGEDVHFAAGVVRDKQLHLPIPVDVLRRHTPNGAPPWLGEGHWLLASARATDWKTKQ